MKNAPRQVQAGFQVGMRATGNALATPFLGTAGAAVATGSMLGPRSAAAYGFCVGEKQVGGGGTMKQGHDLSQMWARC
jgi:hypothetical protein